MRARGVGADLIDPQAVELEEATFRFKHDPLTPPQRTLLGERDHVNGHPLDWALALDPNLEETLVAVREPHTKRPVWFHADRRLRTETFTSPLARLEWRPDQALTRHLLEHVPYVLVLRVDSTVRHAFDLRAVGHPGRLRHVLDAAGDKATPATGAMATTRAEIGALRVNVPYAGERFHRSTRKRFRLRVPDGPGDATVEATSARILQASGFNVESPRLLVAIYRLLVGEVIAHWWRDPVRMESTGATTHHPPGENPLAATRRGLDAVADVQDGNGPQSLKDLGETVIRHGKRPPAYRRYVNRLARLAAAFPPDGLAGVLEGILRGHPAQSADLVATHPKHDRPFLVEVKSSGDRIRPMQAEAALYHERDGRVAYRIMRIEHGKGTAPGSGPRVRPPNVGTGQVAARKRPSKGQPSPG